MQLYHILGLENVFSVFVRKPEAGNYGKGGPGAGTVRARFPAKPKNSVFVREPEDGNYGKGGPDAGTVRARLSAKPKNSVFVREPEDGNYGKGGPDAGTVRARFPAKPMNSVFMREPEGGGCPAGHTLDLAQEYVQEKTCIFIHNHVLSYQRR